MFITDNCKTKKKLNKKPYILKKLNFLTSDSLINPEIGIYKTNTVIGMCLQIAYYMGFKNIILIGCDCFYDNFGNHHFDGSKVDNFFRKDWTDVFEFYKIIKEKMQDVFVCNCTEGGFLEVFPRMDFKIWRKYENDIILKIKNNTI